MIVTKYTHSCLLIENNDTKILIDPGNYSYQAHKHDILSINKIDSLLITHSHPDHMYMPFVKELVEKHPHMKIVADSESRDLLEKEEIVSSNSSEFISQRKAVHEKVFGINPPENQLYEVFGQLTHPGDSLSFTLDTPVLGLPVQAPWCSLTQAVDFALSQKPKIIIPIHDWHWNAEARTAFYERLEKYFAENNVKFISLPSSSPTEITL